MGYNSTYRRYIFRRKLVCGVRDEQAGFTHSTVPNYNTLDGLHSCVLQSSPLIQDLEQRNKQKGNFISWWHCSAFQYRFSSLGTQWYKKWLSIITNGNTKKSESSWQRKSAFSVNRTQKKKKARGGDKPVFWGRPWKAQTRWHFNYFDVNDMSMTNGW